LLTGIVSGVLTSAGSLILGWSRENFKDMYGDDKDRIERIKKLEQSQQLQQNTIKTLDTEGGKQIDIDYEKLKPVSSDTKAIEQLKINQEQNKERDDFKKMIDSINTGLNKHAGLLEALLKKQTENNIALANISNNTLKSNNVIVKNSSNINNFSNKASSNYDFQMTDLGRSVYA
jgi:hypothetical protein